MNLHDQKDNPQAFPSGKDRVWSKIDKTFKTPQEAPLFEGMTLLDWFAGQALAGRLANPHLLENMENADCPPDVAIEAFVRWSYDIAEAMLVERQKRLK